MTKRLIQSIAALFSIVVVAAYADTVSLPPPAPAAHDMYFVTVVRGSHDLLIIDDVSPKFLQKQSGLGTAPIEGSITYTLKDESQWQVIWGGLAPQSQCIKTGKPGQQICKLQWQPNNLQVGKFNIIDLYLLPNQHIDVASFVFAVADAQHVYRVTIPVVESTVKMRFPKNISATAKPDSKKNITAKPFPISNALKIAITPATGSATPTDASHYEYYFVGDSPACGKNELNAGDPKDAEATVTREVLTSHGWQTEPARTVNFILAHHHPAGYTPNKWPMFGAEKPSSGRYRMRADLKGCDTPYFSAEIAIVSTALKRGELLPNLKGSASTPQAFPAGQPAPAAPVNSPKLPVAKTPHIVLAPIAMLNRGLEQGTNRFGGDYTNRDLATAQLCQQACASEAQCKAWTWVKPGVQGQIAKCWLKNSVPAASKNDCCTSGVK
jgi:PAN domain